MPNEKKTLLGLLIDKSSSMKGVQLETIKGVNGLIAEQGLLPDECDVTLVQFSTGEPEFTHLNVPVAKVPPLTMETYKPYGYTALLDAMGRFLDETGNRLAAMPDAQRPGKVVVVVVTDGEENASREYKTAQVAAMVKHQEQKYGWKFVFLGANMDAIAAAVAVGFRAQASSGYVATAQGVAAVYSNVSSKLADLRGGQTVSMDWSAAERASNMQQGPKDGDNQ